MFGIFRYIFFHVRYKISSENSTGRSSFLRYCVFSCDSLVTTKPQVCGYNIKIFVCQPILYILIFFWIYTDIAFFCICCLFCCFLELLKFQIEIMLFEHILLPKPIFSHMYLSRQWKHMGGGSFLCTHNDWTFYLVAGQVMGRSLFRFLCALLPN